MPDNLIATATTTIDAPPDAVWHALTTPALIREYMFGSTVESEWTVGSPITYTGEWEGKKYVDKGEILEVRPGELLRSTHFSPLSGKPDRPENYHTVTYLLTPDGDTTTVTLTQDGNETADEARHSEGNWSQMLAGLKKTVEARQ